MDLIKLQYFLCVANSRSMERASELLNVSQSTLSMAIKKLEQEFGIALFERHGRRDELTAAGRALQSEAASLLVQAENIRQQMQQFRDDPATILTIATEAPDFSAAADILFRSVHANCRTVQNLPRRSAVKSVLQSGRAAFAVTLFDDSDPELSSEAVFSEPLLLLLPASHPLAGQHALSFRQIQAEPLVSLSEDYAFRYLCEYFFTMNGARACHVHELRDPQMTPLAVADGFGVGFYPQSLCPRIHDPAVSVCGIEGSYFQRQVYLTRLKNAVLSPMAQAFYDFLKSLGAYLGERGAYPESAAVLQDRA